MPFRSVVIVKDDKHSDTLDSMLFQQMCGRAGRRGLDKEGNIIKNIPDPRFAYDRLLNLNVCQ